MSLGLTTTHKTITHHQQHRNQFISLGPSERSCRTNTFNTARKATLPATYRDLPPRKAVGVGGECNYISLSDAIEMMIEVEEYLMSKLKKNFMDMDFNFNV